MRRMGPRERRVKKRKLVDRDGSFCCYCGRWLGPTERTFEHVRPLSWGGTHALDNLKLACRECNQRRGNGL